MIAKTERLRLFTFEISCFYMNETLKHCLDDLKNLSYQNIFCRIVSKFVSILTRFCQKKGHFVKI